MNMKKTQNIYIKKARRKRKIKRFVTFFILFIIASVLFATKSSFFVVKNVSTEGETLLTNSYILDAMEEYKGQNIFLLSKSKAVNKLKSNTYIKSVSIKSSMPDTLVVNVTESKGLYYIFDGDDYNIISSDSRILEKNTSINDTGLIQISGVNITGKNIGDNLDTSDRINNLLNELYDEQTVISENNEDFSITAVDVSDISNIKIYLNKIQVIVGTDQDIRSKMNKAVILYKTGMVKEYINVSYDGSPDFK